MGVRIFVVYGFLTEISASLFIIYYVNWSEETELTEERNWETHHQKGVFYGLNCVFLIKTMHFDERRN